MKRARPDWVVVADDLTGACDTGAPFANARKRVRVILSADADLSGADVLVISTNSRDLPADQAEAVVRDRVHSLLAAVERPEETRFYKKIDFDPARPPGGGIPHPPPDAGEPGGLAAPAFPEQGRVVVDGGIRVNGVPLEQTARGKEDDATDLVELFAGGQAGCLLTVAQIRAEPGNLDKLFSQDRVWIGESETAGRYAQPCPGLPFQRVKAGVRVGRPGACFIQHRLCQDS